MEPHLFFPPPNQGFWGSLSIFKARRPGGGAHVKEGKEGSPNRPPPFKLLEPEARRFQRARGFRAERDHWQQAREARTRGSNHRAFVHIGAGCCNKVAHRSLRQQAAWKRGEAPRSRGRDGPTWSRGEAEPRQSRGEKELRRSREQRRFRRCRGGAEADDAEGRGVGRRQS